VSIACWVEMLYILPPPSAPSPPSPWTTILCGSGGGSEGSASGSGGIVRGGIVRTAAGGAVATVVQSSAWGTVTGISKRPPSARVRALRNPKNRVSCIFEGCCHSRVIHLCKPILGAFLSIHKRTNSVGHSLTVRANNCPAGEVSRKPKEHTVSTTASLWAVAYAS